MSAPVDGEKWAFAGTKCPFDALEFRREDQIVLCPDCRTPHHLDCWQEHDGCTQFGCQARGVAPMTADAPLTAELVVLESEDQRRPCEFCGEPILSVARKCKHCGEYLDATLRRERARYLIPFKPELPVGAGALGLGQTLVGIFTSLVGLVVLLEHPGLYPLAGFVTGVTMSSLGIGLNAGKEWARRWNERLMAVATGGAFCVTLAALASGSPGLGITMLFISLLSGGMLSSVRSPECRRFCRIEG